MTDVDQAAFLQEMSRQLMAVSTGRLDVRIEVRADRTGPLADAANHALGSFRGLVLEIRANAQELDHSAHKTQERARRLRKGVEELDTQLSSAVVASQSLVTATQRAHSASEQCRDVAARSLELVKEACSDARLTVDSLARMRASMQETGKRIKRLGESCQEMGEVVRLIDDVADQTNVLAVNAAIQSSSTARDCEGFGIIVEEIRRLAERARGATRDIDTLVRAMQSDSSETVKASEQTTAAMVSATQASSRAGETLAKVEKVTQRLESGFEGIAGSLSKQGHRVGLVVNDLAAADRGVAELKSEADAVNVLLERTLDLVAALYRTQSAYQVSEAQALQEAPRLPQSSTTGTIVLKPAQMSAMGAKAS
jgi:twitching motility protein PilJ